MKKWNRVNKTDRKRVDAGKARYWLRGFMDDKFNKRKRKYVTVVES